MSLGSPFLARWAEQCSVRHRSSIVASALRVFGKIDLPLLILAGSVPELRYLAEASLDALQLGLDDIDLHVYSFGVHDRRNRGACVQGICFILAHLKPDFDQAEFLVLLGKIHQALRLQRRQQSPCIIILEPLLVVALLLLSCRMRGLEALRRGSCSR